MIYPKERPAITKKVRAIAKKMPSFRRLDCIETHFGEHYMEDWQECIDSMVKKGELRMVKNGKLREKLPGRYSKVT